MKTVLKVQRQVYVRCLDLPPHRWKTLDNNDHLNLVVTSSGLVKVCLGCSVSRAHKTYSRSFLLKAVFLIDRLAEQPRPQGFSLKKMGGAVFLGKSPGDEAASKELICNKLIKGMK